MGGSSEQRCGTSTSREQLGRNTQANNATWKKVTFKEVAQEAGGWLSNKQETEEEHFSWESQKWEKVDSGVKGSK